MENDDTDLPAMTGQAETLERALGVLETRSRSFGSALSSALRSAADGGKGLDDVLRSLGSRLTDIALAAGLKPLETMISGAASNLLGGFGKLLPFADGGVVSRPTYFPMGGDIGLMGEAGSEAILPLKRGADGSLGVAASGTAGTSQIVFNVTAADAQSFLKSEAQISSMLARTAMRGQRNL
ncbi:phage tail protein [Rhizobium sp. Root1203]|uniref:phage tail tape measure protein n=1 Tax=Rhizobium sp. Root1203 TaxID=1736427 RepID=UPI00070A72D7|nr:phage tail tape measure protein [Rhizobium sp. Root1203]KQV32618.1 phage tail protein [Rhizobium sp. Root1203]